MSTIATNNITDAAGSGAPNFANGLKLGTAGVLGPVTGDAPMYACRAWVNFNGTGTVAIRASGNVSSITDNGVGDYTVNFTTAMPDADYAVAGSAGQLSGFNGCTVSPNQVAQTTSAMRFVVQVMAGSTQPLSDQPRVNIAIFR